MNRGRGDFRDAVSRDLFLPYGLEEKLGLDYFGNDKEEDK